MILEMGKGPIKRGESVRDSTWRGRSRVDSHTCPRQYLGAGARWRSACRLYLDVVLRSAVQVRRQRLTNMWAEGMLTSCSGKSGGESPVAEQGSVLQVYSIHMSCGVGGDKAVKSCLQVLIGLLQLAVGLRVEPRGHAGHPPNEGAECLPELGRELRNAIGDHVQWKSMDPEDVLDHGLGRLLG